LRKPSNAGGSVGRAALGHFWALLIAATDLLQDFLQIPQSLDISGISLQGPLEDCRRGGEVLAIPVGGSQFKVWLDLERIEGGRPPCLLERFV
jgi:hypothetical protein